MSYREYVVQSIISSREAYNALMKFYPLTLDDLPHEIWREAIDDYHMVSNFGRLKSFCRHLPRICKPSIVHRYLAFEIVNRHGRHRYSVHRLVATAFIPNPDNKPQVNHLDGNKFNNHVSNLEWATPSENIQHSLRLGLKRSGENNYLSVLSNDQVKWLRTVYKPYDKEFGAVALARALGVSEQTIRVAVHGKHYKFI